jgi:hypothetical protein
LTTLAQGALAGRVGGSVDATRGVIFLAFIVGVQVAFWLLCRTFPRIVAVVISLIVLVSISVIFASMLLAFGLVTRTDAWVLVVVSTPAVWLASHLIAKWHRKREQKRFEYEIKNDPVRKRLWEEAREVGKPPRTRR